MPIFRQKEIECFKLAFIKVNTAQQRYYFPDLPELRNVYLDSLSYYESGMFPVNKESVPLVDASTPPAFPVFLTLYSEGRERIMKLDCAYLKNLNYTNPNGYSSIKDGRFNFGGIKVDFSKSFVQYASGSTPQTPPYSFLFGIFYTPMYIQNPTASNV